MNAFGIASYGIAALSFLVLTVLLITAWRGRQQGAHLILASAMTMIWAGVLAAQSYTGAVPVLLIYLAEALRGALTQLRTHPNGLQIAFSADNLPSSLPAAVEAATYRITMEAVTNVIKHAQAQHCWITLQTTIYPSAMQITIEDDGVGLPAHVILPGVRA